MDMSSTIELDKKKCPYCQTHTLQLIQIDHAHCALECFQCGARGPKRSSQDMPRMLMSLSNYNLLRTVIDEYPDVIFIKNIDGKFTLCNKALADLYNTTPEQMLGKSDADFNDNAEQVAFYLDNSREIIESGKTKFVVESSTDAKTGEIRHYQSIKKPIISSDGSVQVLVIAHDITDLQKAHQAVEESEKRYNFAMDASNVGIWDWNIVTNQVHHNGKWCEMLGLEDDMRIHDMAILDKFIHPNDREKMMNAVDNALRTNGFYESEHRMIRVGGEVIWVHDRGRVVESDENGSPIRMVGSFNDITLSKRFERQLARTSRELERNNETLEQIVLERTEALESVVRELENIATKDQLTGLGNRLMLEQWLQTQSDEQELVSILVDLDHFKSINDRFGHQVGDEVLKATGECLSKIRESDLIIRWGGEEFLIILTHVSLKQAYLIAENLRINLEHLDVLPNQESVTASFGICAKAFYKIEFDAAIQQSDEALYEAKQSGRNQVKIFSFPVN